MINIEMLERTLPVAPLKLIAMESCQALGQKVNDYIVSFRENTINEVTESPLYVNYKSNNYLVDCSCPRFGSGEAKGVLKETIRGFKKILDGECDDIPESCFLFAGTIDDVYEKAKQQQ